MILKGIEKGDGKFRHFTFDDDKVEVIDGVQYYNVNYGKDPAGGEFADEEHGYVRCEMVMTLGGRKAKPVAPLNPEPEQKAEEKPKSGRGRPAKTKTVTTESTTYPVASGTGKFEYDVCVIKGKDVEDVKTKLNSKGSKGWEMCGFDTNKSLLGEIQFIAVFKKSI